MAYTLLGYGTTDSNGIATLDHDANGNPITHSYTGTGAGKINVVASLDNEIDISESSILSEIYEITDCLFYDDAVTGRVNSDWVNSINRLTITVDDEGTLLEAPSDLNGYYISNLPNTSSGSVQTQKNGMYHWFWNVML